MSRMGNFRRMAPVRKAMFFAGVGFFLLYFALGAVFLLVRNLPFAMSPGLRIGFGILLVAYSIFRLVRLAGELKNVPR